MSVRRRRPQRKNPELTKNKIDKLEFAYSSPRQTTNFGWGMSGSKGLSNTFVSTEDVRIALDNAFRTNDIEGIRAVSQHFFKTSGVYASAARYLAYMPTYSYLLMPRVLGMEVDEKTITRAVINQLRFLEDMKLKTSLKNIALDVIVDGVSFVYFRRRGSKAVIQKLPVNWCRTRGFSNGFPTVEFNLRYFDKFPNQQEKIRMLNSFPPEIVSEFNKLKQDRYEGKNTSGRRLNSTMFDDGNWITLDPNHAAAFYFNPSLQPILANSFFAILDVLELKGIEKRKAENELYNLVVQHFPLNDDDEPVFDIIEMEAFHNSAKQIFENTRQTDLLTTFAEVSNVNLNEASSAPIDFTNWTKDVYSEMGVSQQLFSTEGNMALEKSQNVDMALIFTLVEKFEDWLNFQLDYNFRSESEEDDLFYTRLQILKVTDHNKEKFATQAKDFATLGYSAFLPAVAMGQSQLDLMSSIVFENNILDIKSHMKPLQSSHTASSSGGSSSGGRPPLPESEKSDKTIANQGG